MVDSDRPLKAVSVFSGGVMVMKETAEQMREDDVLSHPTGRRRSGRGDSRMSAACLHIKELRASDAGVFDARTRQVLEAK